MEFGTPGGGEILQKVGSNFRRDEEITAAFPHADIPHCLPTDARPHQRSQKIPVAGAVPLIEGGSQTGTGRILLKESSFFQIVRKKNQHFPLGIPIAAKKAKPFGAAKEVFRHFLLPRRQETGGSRDVLANTGVYFVPEFGKKYLIFRRLGDFFNVGTIHDITNGDYTIPFRFV